MGTFHDNLGELHGITVAVATRGTEAMVGRCHEANDHHVILLDADVHHEGEGDVSNEAWVRRAAKWGVFGRHKVLKLRREDVTAITPLGRIETQ